MIWYPYTQQKTMAEAYNVSSADGVYLNLADGRRVIDAISSWWCVIHGYNHPELNAAAIRQLNKMAHVMLGGLTHDPALELARTLVRITPAGLNHVFFSDSGSVGVEVALKMAIQYWQNLGEKEKVKILTLKKAYHGDTTGAMSVSDPEEGMHRLFSPLLLQQCFLEAPRMGVEPDAALLKSDIHHLESVLKHEHRRLAAFIVEPLMQAAGGFNMYAPEYLQAARDLCNRYNVLLIYDEVATGFGRTGAMFAAERAGAIPDIMILAKGLTAGYTAHAATLANDKVYTAFYDDDPAKAFMHGPTFMGNPLACAIALKSIQIFERDNYLEKINRIESQLKTELSGLTGEHVKDTRVLGATGVIEMTTPAALNGVTRFALDRGVWLRPFDRYLYTMPPYIISSAELKKITDVMKEWVTSKQE